MGGNRLDDALVLAETLGEIRAEFGVRPLQLVVHGLADVVQQPGPLRLPHVKPQLRGHHARQMGHLDGVLQYVLGKTRAILELAQKGDDLGVDVVGAHVEGSPFARLLDDLVHFALHLADHVLDSAGMNPAVADEALQGDLRHLPAHGIEGGKHHRLGRVVDDEIDARRRLDGPNVAALAADDPPFHLVRREIDDRHGTLGHEIPGIALDGIGDDLLGLLVGDALGLFLGLADEDGRFALGLGLKRLDELGLRLFGREAGDPLELLLLVVDNAVEAFVLFVQGVFFLLEPPFAVLDIAFLLDEQIDAFLLVLLLGAKAHLELVELGLAVPGLPLELGLRPQQALLGLQDGLLLDVVGLFLGLLDDPDGKILRRLLFLAGEHPPHKIPEGDTRDERRDGDDNG